MKKTTLIASALFFPISIINGQNVSFGIQGGADYSKLIQGDEALFTFGSEFKTGYRAGLNTTVDLAEWVAVRAEFNVQREGGKSKLFFTDENGNNIGEGRYLVHFDYLSLPLMMQFSFGKKIKLFDPAWCRI